MLCENCGKREANVRYSENINGRKKEMHLCEDCSKLLGIDHDFRIPSIDFSNLFGSFLEDFATPELFPLIADIKEESCDVCGSTFNDIINTGRYGCPNCYDTFETRMDPILKKLQGNNRHKGRLEKISDNTKIDDINKNENKNVDKEKTNKKANKIEELQEELKQAIKEERYEDAAVLRDKIKKEEEKEN